MNLPLKDSPRSASSQSAVSSRAWVPAALVLSIVCLQSCSRSPAQGGSASSGASPSTWDDQDIARGRAVANSPSSLPARPIALALADSLQTQAEKEGRGVRSADLYAVAAAIRERLWRVDGQERDGAAATALYRNASRDLWAPHSCEIAVHAAGLAGDIAHDASVAYGELYRLKREGNGMRAAGAVSPPSCEENILGGLGNLAAFRPSQSVLDAIAEGVEGQAVLEAAPGPTAESTDAGGPLGQPPRIVHVDAWPGRDAARVVIELDRPAAYRTGDEVLAPAKWPRTFVDLDGVDLAGPPQDLAETGVVTHVRTESSSTGARVSLDLDGRAFRRVFYMQEPYRIVIDVARRPPGAAGKGGRDVTRVVLDPGHGGKDSGAVGSAGVAEKDVTLDVARRVARVLGAQGLAVLLTRQEDRFVSLEERTARANAFSADLFVSIHCNASEGRTRRGVETYVLDTTRDEIAMRIAARENATTPAASADLATMLSRMRLADQAERSTRFAHLLERSAVSILDAQYTDVNDGGVHVAGFYVLVGARMPSVLFESSYISNPSEEQRLGSDAYRQLLADSIANAVRAYREGR